MIENYVVCSNYVTNNENKELTDKWEYSKKKKNKLEI